MTKTEEEKVHAEINKLLAEHRKLLSEASLNEKRTKWYEVALFLGIGAALAVAVMKFSG